MSTGLPADPFHRRSCRSFGSRRSYRAAAGSHRGLSHEETTLESGTACRARCEFGPAHHMLAAIVQQPFLSFCCCQIMKRKYWDGSHLSRTMSDHLRHRSYRSRTSSEPGGKDPSWLQNLPSFLDSPTSRSWLRSLCTSVCEN